MRKPVQTLLNDWFRGLNSGSISELVALFAESPVIRNAANPPTSGPAAARTLLTDFFNRTRSRTFTIVDAAENNDDVFAAWTAELVFRAGAQIGDLTLPCDVPVRLRGIERFRLDQAFRIVELDIVHETTSVPRALGDAARTRHIRTE
jgi:hypothetical protein